VLDAESGRLLDPLEIDVALSADYAHEPLAVFRRVDGGLERAGAIVGPRVSSQLVVDVGLLDWLAVGVEVPVVLFQTRDRGLGLNPLPTTGLGDLRVGPKLRLLRAADAGVDLAVLPTITAPTSQPHGAYFGEKFFTFAPELAASRDILGAHVVANLGYRARSIASVGGAIAGHEAFYRLGGGLPLGDSPIELDATVHGAVAVVPAPFGDTPLEGLLGMKATLGDVVVSAAGGAGLIGAPGVPDFRVLLGARWIPNLVDGDKDGVDNAADRCPDQQEDIDGLADGDGCAEDDADSDGLVDLVDRCPVDAEDKDAFEDADGCPDLDDDMDGIVDASDRCPRQPGVERHGGCRPPDTDGDRVADEVDACPNEPAPGQKDGCVPKSVVEVKAERIEIHERFSFAIDSARLESSSLPLCDQIAAVLAAHPELTRIRIEGHTDDTGHHAYNLKLSQRRAEAVREALVARGVAADRLEAKGYGAGRPRVEGAGEAARRENRRVELVVVDATESAEEKP
jgi:outer membrane protein OmpA-like peptidoglycan-associated protein